MIFAGVMWLLFRTLKLDFRVEHPDTNPYTNSTGACYIYSVWHDSMLIPTFGGKHRNSSALTSRHDDGSFVAQVLRFVGVSSIRGSTNRIAPAAVRELLQAARNQNIVIAPDGPRGPNRQMSGGIVHLASCTRLAIVPTAYACSRCWRFRGSWSDLIIPKPFARVYLLAAKPLCVPDELPPDSRQQYVTVLQAEMDRLTAVAEQLATNGHTSTMAAHRTG
jgi:lysophospholipid acyltransferase (LPLAT)-like uncharacterized protein